MGGHLESGHRSPTLGQGGEVQWRVCTLRPASSPRSRVSKPFLSAAWQQQEAGPVPRVTTEGGCVPRTSVQAGSLSIGCRVWRSL